jgi:thiol-disulfide isomerase/thioredoxin
MTLTPCQMRSLLEKPLSYDSFGEYKAKHNHEGTITCVIAGILVFWVIMSLMKSSSTPYYARNNLNPIYYPSNILTTSARMVQSVVSGRTADSDELDVSKTGLMNLNQCRNWLKVPVDESSKKIVVADCKGGDWKNLKDEERAVIDKKFQEFLQKNDDVLIMVFAPWCPHCHQIMPKFVKMAKKVKGNMALCNAEACERASFTEGSGKTIFPLQYFPTFLHKKGGKIHEVEINDLLDKFGDDEGSSAKLVEEEVYADDYDVEYDDVVDGEMLDKLF